MLMLYKEEWKSRFLKYPNDDDPLIASTRFDIPTRLHQKGVRSRVDKIVTKIGLRGQLKKGKRRYEVKLDHGFRKYFNTMMRRAKVNYLDKEDMMGHKVGLESHYERYNEQDFERFPEYQKAIPYLTISKASQKQIELDNTKAEFEKTSKDNSLIKKKVSFYEEHLIKQEEQLKKQEERLQEQQKQINNIQKQTSNPTLKNSKQILI